MPGVSGEAVKAGAEVAEALWKRILKSPKTHAAIGGTALPLHLDYMMNNDPDATWGVTTIKDLFSPDIPKWRKGNILFNAVLGAGAGHSLKSNFGNSMLAAGGAVGKDFAITNLTSPKDLVKVLADNAKQTQQLQSNQNKLLGALGLGALGLGGLGIWKYLKDRKEKEGAKMRIKIPGKKGDPSTDAEVELPINMPQMSPALTEDLDRTVRIRARKNIRANSMKRDPLTGKLIPYDEWKEKYGNSKLKNREPNYPLPQLPPSFAQQLEKASSTRTFHEGLGSLLWGGIGGGLGGLAGEVLSHRLKINPRIGSMAGSALGAFLPAIIARGLASLGDKRTAQEQVEHDAETPVGEYLIPGYAAYESYKRTDLAASTNNRIAQNSYAATGQEMPRSYAGSEEEAGDDLGEDAAYAEDYEDEEEKAASAGPPQGGGGGGGKDPRMSRQVPPDLNRIGKGFNQIGDPNKAKEASQNALTQVGLVDMKVQPRQAQHPMSLSEIPSTMDNVKNTLTEIDDRLRGIKTSRIMANA